MAHFTKFKASGMGQMFAHINRDRSAVSKYGNADIDPAKTAQNIVLVQGDLGTLQKRLGEVAHSARSDLVVCAGVVITLPEELKEEKAAKQSDFFKECHKFLSQKFGAENCVYSVIHNDETTPHLHYGFVPVVEKEIKYRSKEKRGQTYVQKRVCADDVITRKMLQGFHDELQAHISKKFPDVRIVAEEKEERLKQNKSLQELKQEEINKLTLFANQKKKNKRNLIGMKKKDEFIINGEQYEILTRKTEELLSAQSGKMFEENQQLKTENANLKRYAADATQSKNKDGKEYQSKIDEMSQRMGEMAEKIEKLESDKEIAEEKVKSLERKNTELKLEKGFLVRCLRKVWKHIENMFDDKVKSSLMDHLEIKKSQGYSR